MVLYDHFISDITYLKFVTLDAAPHCYYLHCGHLEQLAITYPHLEYPNMGGNNNCVKKLQGF